MNNPSGTPVRITGPPKIAVQSVPNVRRIPVSLSANDCRGDLRSPEGVQQRICRKTAKSHFPGDRRSPLQPPGQFPVFDGHPPKKRPVRPRVRLFLDIWRVCGMIAKIKRFLFPVLKG